MDKSKFRKTFLTNGTVLLETPRKMFRTAEGKYQPWGSYATMAFTFTNPKDSTYFKLLHVFYASPEPIRITDAKESIGIYRHSWGDFTPAVQAFGILERVPHSWNWRLTPNGEKYVSEILSGRDKFWVVQK